MSWPRPCIGAAKAGRCNEAGLYDGCGAAGLRRGAAQDIDKQSRSKLKVEDGKTITVTGCVERGSDGDYVLTNVAGKDGSLGSYILATSDADDLENVAKHVIASRSRVRPPIRYLKGLPFPGVRSMRTIASVCP
jgi:hypothetical protein